MAAKLDDDDIPDAFICPITQELMKNPVILIADSQSYESSALEEWFATGRRISPYTGKKVGSTSTRRNFALKNAIAVWYSVFLVLVPLVLTQTPQRWHTGWHVPIYWHDTQTQMVHAEHWRAERQELVRLLPYKAPRSFSALVTGMIDVWPLSASRWIIPSTKMSSISQLRGDFRAIFVTIESAHSINIYKIHTVFDEIAKILTRKKHLNTTALTKILGWQGGIPLPLGVTTVWFICISSSLLYPVQSGFESRGNRILEAGKNSFQDFCFFRSQKEF